MSSPVEAFVELDPDALDTTIRELELERRRVEADLAAALAVVEQRGDHTRDGHRGLNGYIKATTNVSGSDAYWLRQRSRMVNLHPQIGDRSVPAGSAPPKPTCWPKRSHTRERGTSSPSSSHNSSSTPNTSPTAISTW